MDKIVWQSLRLLLIFLKNTWGSLNRPYETYRRLVLLKNPGQTLPLFFLIGIYFTLAQKIRGHFFNLSLALFGFVLTYFLVLTTLSFLGRKLGGKGNWQNLFLPWTYSLLPTLLWFLTTSLFYVLLPPPRQLTLPGIIFSFVFVVFSVMLFFWKGMLYYLTLRFALKLSFGKIILLTLFFLPGAFVYSLIMYRLGIFRVPFI